jgi:hypothetical protein
MSKTSVLNLATQVYSDLNAAEKQLLGSADSGSITVLPSLIDLGTGTQSPPISAGDSVIRAEVIQWICTNREAASLITPRGINLVGGKIAGQLNLSHATIAFPLELRSCLIPDGMRLEYATLGNLNLSGSITAQIWGVWLTVQKDLTLSNNFRSDGGVFLDRARITGDLYCAEGTFINAAGSALSAMGSRIQGSVYLTNGFHAEGETNFALSIIDGSLICSGGQFHNPSSESTDQKLPRKRALAANQAQFGGSVFLRDHAYTLGEVDFIAAKITGDLDCNGARFSNPGKKAFAGDRISIGSNAFFNRGFEIDGILSMPGASIEGEIDFEGSRFVGDADNGVRLETSTIKRTMFWRNLHLTARTKLILNDATVGRYLDDEKSWPTQGNLFIFGFKYGRIAGVKTADSRRQWLELQTTDGVNLQPYQQLAAVLREAGHEAESTRVLIAKEDKRYQQGGVNRLNRIWGYILKASIGYGYAPRRALYWGAGIVLVCALLFWVGYNNSLFAPVSDGVYKDPGYLASHTPPDGYQTFNPLIYSLDVFLPIVDLHQEGKWLPNPSRQCRVMSMDLACGAYLRIALWVEIVIGWGLTTLVVAGFSGLVRRD